MKKEEFIVKANDLAKSLSLDKMGEDSYYGLYEGYEINMVIFHKGALPLRFLISTHIDRGDIDKVKERLLDYDDREHRIEIDEIGVSILFSSSYKKDINMKTLPSFIDNLIQIFSSLGLKGRDYCPLSGEFINELNSKIYSSGKAHIRLSISAAESLNSFLDDIRKRIDALPSNFGRAFGLASIGVLLGAIIEALFLYLGFIAGIPALISVWLGNYFFMKGKGKLSYKMVISIGIFTLVLFMAIFLVYYAYIANELIKGPSVFASFMEAFKNGAFLMDFIIEAIFILVFVFSGCVIPFIYVKRRITIPEKLK